MRIVKKHPTFWFVVKWFYPLADLNTAAFCFADTVYTFAELTPAQIAHEEVHIKQMHGSKFIGCIHFLRFVSSKKFRRRVEEEAYKVQYKGDMYKVNYMLSNPLYRL